MAYYEGDFAELLTKYETDFPSLYDRLNSLNDQMFEAVSDYTWSTEQINEAITSVDEIIVDETRKKWDEYVEKRISTFPFLFLNWHTPTAPLLCRTQQCQTKSGSMVQLATSRLSMVQQRYGTRVHLLLAAR